MVKVTFRNRTDPDPEIKDCNFISLILDPQLPQDTFFTCSHQPQRLVRNSDDGY